MDKFKLVSDYKLSGDQPEAVAKLHLLDSLTVMASADLAGAGVELIGMDRANYQLAEVLKKIKENYMMQEKVKRKNYLKFMLMITKKLCLKNISG